MGKGEGMDALAKLPEDERDDPKYEKHRRRPLRVRRSRCHTAVTVR